MAHRARCIKSDAHALRFRNGSDATKEGRANRYDGSLGDGRKRAASDHFSHEHFGFFPCAEGNVFCVESNPDN